MESTGAGRCAGAGCPGLFLGTLLLDSGVLRDQSLNECRQQRLASLADVVYKLEEPEVEREFLLGNAPMRTTPAAQQRPVTVDGRITPSTSASEPRVRAFHARGSSAICPLSSAPFR